MQYEYSFNANKVTHSIIDIAINGEVEILHSMVVVWFGEGRGELQHIFLMGLATKRYVYQHS